MTKLLAVVALALAGAVAGCGGSDDDARDGRADSPSLGHPAPGGGLTIAEAIDSDADPPLLVRGYVVDDGKEARFCSALAESHPPQCGGPSLRLEGAGDADLGELERANGVEWTEHEVALLGEIDGDLFRVSATAKA